MNKLAQIGRCLFHPRELRMTLSGLGVRLAGDHRLGGLSAEETAGLVGWIREARPAVFVEIGTLFGFTAKAVAATGVRVVAVDNFSWNPFGLSSADHEAFARRILEGTSVELVNADAADFLARLSERLGVPADRCWIFLDGDHRYEAVKRELELCRQAGVRHFSGHDWDNSGFGVTRAVREVLGEPDAVVGSCWRNCHNFTNMI